MLVQRYKIGNIPGIVTIVTGNTYYIESTVFTGCTTAVVAPVSGVIQGIYITGTTYTNCSDCLTSKGIICPTPTPTPTITPTPSTTPPCINNTTTPKGVLINIASNSIYSNCTVYTGLTDSTVTGSTYCVGLPSGSTCNLTGIDPTLLEIYVKLDCEGCCQNIYRVNLDACCGAPPINPSPTPTKTPTKTPTVTPTKTPTPTKTVTPTITPTKTITPTITPTRTVTPTITPTKTVTPTITPTPTVTPSSPSPFTLSYSYDKCNVCAKTSGTLKKNGTTFFTISTSQSVGTTNGSTTASVGDTINISLIESVTGSGCISYGDAAISYEIIRNGVIVYTAAGSSISQIPAYNYTIPSGTTTLQIDIISC